MEESLYDLLKRLESTSSRNDKIAILNRVSSHSEVETWKKAWQMCYSPFMRFNRTTCPRPTSTEPATSSLKTALDELEILSENEIRGNALDVALLNIGSKLSSDDLEIFCRVVQKDMKCGVNVSSINKVYGKNFIPEFDFMLCDTDMKDIIWPAYSQPKADGVRASAFCREKDNKKNITVISRNGQEIDVGTNLKTSLLETLHDGLALDGELVFFDSNGIAPLDRKTSNGLVNKCIKSGFPKEYEGRLYFIVWDNYAFDVETQAVRYDDRLHALSVLLSEAGNSSKYIRIIETDVVECYEAAMVKYQEARRAGQEGTIVKNIAAFWQPKRTRDCVKMKAEFEVDLLITGFEYGKLGTKYEKCLGAIQAETSDGLLKVSVGSGWSDEERQLTKEYIGKIITVRANQTITQKDSGAYSLFLPRKIEIREDKSTSNSLQEVLDIEKALIR